MSAMSEQQTVYDMVGGAPTFKRLVDTFYGKIEQDPELRPVFPPDMEEGKEGQYLFLMQYFGGPPIYNQQRGHPRLRMRHMPFEIGRHEADLWLKHMLASVDEVGIQEPARSLMREYFLRFAHTMVTRPDKPAPSSIKLNEVKE
ncbi:MAG TPA: globin [Chloroflexia bacterium]|nr:globin [Chloroflexia bacterium]